MAITKTILSRYMKDMLSSGISLKYNNSDAICLFRVNITMIHFVADVTFTEKSYNLATWHACRRKDYIQNLYGFSIQLNWYLLIWKDNVCLTLFLLS